MIRRKRHGLEYVLVSIMVMAVGALVVSNLYYQNKLEKERAMFYQLQILRSALNIYKIINRNNPASLVELASGTYQFPDDDTTKKYVENAPIDKYGHVTDPFGAQYQYDSEWGWIRSGTHGYEFW